MNRLLQTCAVFLAAPPTLIMAENVGVFFAQDAAQIEFAAREVKAALGGDANGAMNGGLQIAENKMYAGMSMARSADLPHWRYHDAAVLQEYTRNGGAGIPERPQVANPAIEFPRR